MSDRPLSEVSTVELRCSLAYACSEFADRIRAEIKRRKDAEAKGLDPSRTPGDHPDRVVVPTSR